MNSIHTISPYKTTYGEWVFDDPDKGLKKEPFVAGIPEMIEAIVDGEKTFTVRFSKKDFVGSQVKLTRTTKERGGAWYSMIYDGKEFEGWLCPALLKYFSTHPKNLFLEIVQ
jgi:hypothetical protein